MASIFDLVIQTVSGTPGTGSTLTLGSAATINGSTYLTLALAGITNGQTVELSLIDPVNGGVEQSVWTYSTTGPSLSGRTVRKSSNGNSAINASSSTLIRCSPPAELLNDGSLFTTGTVDTARLGSGTANSSTFLRGDQSWAAIVSTGRLIGFNFYTSSQTITIPAGATQCFVEMSGGASGLNGNGSSGGGALRKYLSSITAGLTLALTIGASGGTNGNGGNSTLASGTQTITTLTASGGSTGGNSGNGSNGDANFSGLSFGIGGSGVGVTALGLGWGYNGSGTSNTTAGICQIWWFS